MRRYAELRGYSNQPTGIQNQHQHHR